MHRVICLSAICAAIVGCASVQTTQLSINSSREALRTLRSLESCDCQKARLATQATLFSHLEDIWFDLRRNGFPAGERDNLLKLSRETLDYVCQHQEDLLLHYTPASRSVAPIDNTIELLRETLASGDDGLRFLALFQSVKSEEQRMWKEYLDSNLTKWGNEKEGLQLGVLTDEENPVIHCFVRNASTNNITCDEFNFGYCELVRLEYFDGKSWINLSRVGPLGLCSMCSGKTQVVAPGQVIQARSWVRFEAIVPAVLSKADTFVVDFRAFKWPSDARTARIRIVQKFRTARSTKNELISPEILLQIPEDRKHWWRAASGEEKSDVFDLKFAFDDGFTIRTNATIGQPFKLKAKKGPNTHEVSGVLGPPTRGLYPLNYAVRWGSDGWFMGDSQTEWPFHLNQTISGSWSAGLMRGYEITFSRHTPKQGDVNR